MYCKKCGHEIPDGARFCNRCGAPVKKKKHTGFLIGLIVCAAAVVMICVFFQKEITKSDASEHNIRVITQGEDAREGTADSDVDRTSTENNGISENGTNFPDSPSGLFLSKIPDDWGVEKDKIEFHENGNVVYNPSDIFFKHFV